MEMERDVLVGEVYESSGDCGNAIRQYGDRYGSIEEKIDSILILHARKSFASSKARKHSLQQHATSAFLFTSPCSLAPF